MQESTTLYFTQGASDKIYQAQLVEESEGWLVNFQYGRRGKPLTSGTKTKAPVAYDVAKKAYDKLVTSKTSKGYTPNDSGQAYVDTQKAGDVTAYQPQLLNPITRDELETILNDWGYVCAQTKHDGERRGILHSPEITGANRRGLRVGLAEDIKTALTALMDTHTATLDCEDMGDHLVIFDVLDFNSDPLATKPFSARINALKTIQETIDTLGLSSHLKVDIPETFTTLKDLESFVSAAYARKEEGVVLRNPKATYEAGRPNSGGNALKLKFVESATVRVKTPHSTKRSVSIEVSQGGSWIDVGNVTIPGTLPIPAKGALIEVEYLYAYEGGSLYQPVYKGQRTDLCESAATRTQLKFKA